jgi:hypothetical protein
VATLKRASVILLLVAACGLAGYAQQQVRGQVVNRDGVAQQCQVAFYAGGPDPVYRATSDRQGYFYLNGPRAGAYRVLVVQGNRQDEFKRVTIDREGLHPSTLVVRW